MELSFFAATKKHEAMIRSWLIKEHVKPYFHGDGLENTLKKLGLFVQGINHNGKYFFEHWVACAENKPFGFLMTSTVEGPHDPNNHYKKWVEAGGEVITLDLLIGEEEFLGKGLAVRMIQEFLLDKFSHVSTVLIDPGAHNARAIHVYEKAGFKVMEGFVPDFDPVPHLMMRLEMVELKKNLIR